jgi:tetratricopeptide (TPR) repeat protein
VPPNIFEAPLPAYTPGPASRPAQRLLDKAKDEWTLSHRDQAFALLDRAFRIDSQSAEISLRHSQAYFEIAQYQKAENWARRAIGNSLIAPDQLHLAWHLIARARYRLGDQDGAHKAMEKAQQSE